MEVDELVKTGMPSRFVPDMVGLTAVVSMVMVGLLVHAVSVVLQVARVEDIMVYGGCIYGRVHRARVKVSTYALGLREGVASSSLSWPSMAALAISREDAEGEGEEDLSSARA